MTIIYILLGIGAGALIGYLIARLRASSRISALTTEREVALQKAENLRQSLSDAEQRGEKLRQEAEAGYKEALESLRQRQKEQMDEQMKLLREQMNTSAEEILRRRQDQLAKANSEQLAAILNPLNLSIDHMRRAVEDSKTEQTRTMASLQTIIRSSLEQAKAVGESADRLASALTGENKTQGNFGELKLKELLDSMGLQEGLEYDTQQTLRTPDGLAIHDDETGSRLVPDVILHFPDHRDMVIDSKMSFKAFEEYQAATSPDEKAAALKRHVASVRSHVRELKGKDYSRYLNRGTAHPDFVIMYVFSEGALHLALTADPSLWNEAYRAGVLITGSQNMYALLRILEMSWRQVRQVENQQKIMDAAGEVVKRVQILSERMAKADDALRRTVRAFADVDLMAAPSGRSITTAARKLISYGAKPDPRHKAIPDGGDAEALPAGDEPQDAED